MRRAFWLAPAALAACTPIDRAELTRDAASAAIRPVVERQFPGIPLSRSIDCVLYNASPDELLGLASDTLTGPTESTVQVVASIASRPATIGCLAGEAVPELLQRRAAVQTS